MRSHALCDAMPNGPDPDIHLSLSRFNYASPTYEGHPAMMAGVAARLLGWQRGLTEWNEARHLVDSHPGESQECRRTGPQARAGTTSQRGDSVPRRHRGP